MKKMPCGTEHGAGEPCAPSGLKRQPCRRLVRSSLIVLILVSVLLTPLVEAVQHVPAEVRMAIGDAQRVEWTAPVPVEVRATPGARLSADGTAPVRDGWSKVRRFLAIQGDQAGTTRVEMRLWGIIPLPSFDVNVVERPEVVPGGQAIGVILDGRGVLVVAVAPVAPTEASPAAEAGIRPGDLLLALDGRPVEQVADISRHMQERSRPGGEITVRVERGGQLHDLTLTPTRDPDEGRYLLGLWVRDRTTGVGTLSFHTLEGAFAALGHMVSDQVVGRPLEMEAGRIVGASIAGIRRGHQGDPGEKIGAFSETGPELGVVLANTRFGLIGLLQEEPPPGPIASPLPIALPHEVATGTAQMITVIDGMEPASFELTIERISERSGGDGKDMVIKVSDADLVRQTGGIVQGMSGSPILQEIDGELYLVGVVTHVFVSEPTRGYAIFADTMYQETVSYQGAMQQFRRAS